MAWSQGNLNNLSQQALNATGGPVVPELQQALQAALTTLAFETKAEKAKEMTQFTVDALTAMRSALQQELSQSLSQTSLAGISELSARNTYQRAAASTKQVNRSMLTGLSESGDEPFLSEADRALPSAPMGAPTPEGAPAGSALPLTEGGMPTTALGQGTNQADTQTQQPQPSHNLAQPESQSPSDSTAPSSAAPDQTNLNQSIAPAEEDQQPEETVDQYREREVANALQAEQQQRAASGQAAMTAQEQSHFQMGLSTITNEGAKIGQKLKENIKTGSFSSFILCLAIALTKDIIEPIAWFYFDPGFTGTVLSLFLGGILTALLLSEGVWFRRWLLKKFIGKALIAFIASLIPGVNVVFPEYTVGVLLMGYDNFNAIQKLKQTLTAHEAMMAKISKLARNAPRTSQNTIRKLRQQLQANRLIADE